mmetsp:Transcript_113567/g.169857  ORF Transcript_113567/g.169857 Transcript_113567/m.169857 type:complete len:300 (-) Transcript_113567:434-1333(-)
MMPQTPIGSDFHAIPMNLTLRPFTLVPTTIGPRHFSLSFKAIHHRFAFVHTSIRKVVGSFSVSGTVVQVSNILGLIRKGECSFHRVILLKGTLELTTIMIVQHSDSFFEIIDDFSFVDALRRPNDALSMPVAHMPVALVNSSRKMILHGTFSMWHLLLPRDRSGVKSPRVVSVPHFRLVHFKRRSAIIDRILRYLIIVIICNRQLSGQSLNGTLRRLQTGTLDTGTAHGAASGFRLFVTFYNGRLYFHLFGGCHFGSPFIVVFVSSSMTIQLCVSLLLLLPLLRCEGLLHFHVASTGRL